MEITEDRFITVANGSNVSLEEVQSGVLFDILPIAGRVDGKIQLDMKITSSRFNSGQSDSALSRTRSTFKSNSLVNTGETIIIGGLMLDASSHSVAGIPGLRDIPLLNLFLSSRDTGEKQLQSIIYILCT